MNGPKLWDPLLESISAVYGSAVVAGGAVRDWAVHKNINPRDVDVFVPAADELDLEMGIKALKESFVAIKLLEPDKSEYGPQELINANVVGVLEMFDYRGVMSVKLNIIGKSFDVYDSDRLFADFDHSLCNFSYNGVDVVSHADAKETLDTSLIKVYTPTDRTRKRLEALTKRNKSYERFTFDAAAFPPKAKSKYELYVEQVLGGQKAQVAREPIFNAAAFDQLINPPQLNAGRIRWGDIPAQPIRFIR
jgi:hypothetical protein